jgi:PHP family Zn ribbon phosphoesterase
MNWRVRDLDAISLISNSDAHSLRKIGREANVLELSEQEFSYGGIIAAIRERSPAKFLYTIEFFPEEGKYHLDGHRDHSFSCTPEETKTFGGICPVCGKKLLRGVLSRVDDLSVRKAGDKPAGAIPYRSVIPLEEVIAETLGVGVASKRVSEYYEKYVAQVPEFPILLDLALPELANLVGANLAESIMRVRQGKVSIEPGYDGVFGKIQIYSSQEKEKLRKKPAQPALF